jgi:hypothetical protein
MQNFTKFTVDFVLPSDNFIKFNFFIIITINYVLLKKISSYGACYITASERISFWVSSGVSLVFTQ